MDASEYVDTVTGQMRCKRAREMVAKELSAHIQDQTNACLAAGMTPLEASEEAVRQMGDAVEVGMEMDRIHRPRLDKKTLILIGVFSLAAMFFQTVVLGVMRREGLLYAERKTVVFQVLLGVIIMVVLLYADYTFIGRFPRAVWIGLMVALCGIGNGYGRFWISLEIPLRLQTYLILGLFLPAFAGIIYRYRNRRWKGLFISFAWMTAGFAVIFGSGSWINRCHGFYLLPGFLLLISYAVAKGWYGISPRKGLCAVWGTVCAAVAGIAVYGGFYAPAHVRMRLLEFAAPFRYAMLGLGVNDVGEPRTGANAVLYIQEVWANGWIGRGSRILQDYYPAHEGMSFFILVERLGLGVGLLILAGLAMLLYRMLKGTFCQKSMLGGLVGMACVLGLFVPVGIHLLCNFGLLPLADAVIPFLYPGWVANAGCYTLLGLYLSVNRSTDVVA